MRRYWIALFLLLALFPRAGAAIAQTVFFDDFDGDALLPHWNSVPQPSHWDYSISNSMLSVTSLNSPSNPKVGANYISLGAHQAYAPQTDFQLDARLGWGSSEGVGTFDLTVKINQGGVATIGYHGNGFGQVILGAALGGVTSIPAPPPGMYDFRITRTAGVFKFYFDGNLFANFHTSFMAPVDGLEFDLRSLYPGPSGPFFFDSVQIQTIPSPGTLPMIVAVIATRLRRRRD